MQLSEFEQGVVEQVLGLSGPVLHASRSALRHLDRAWALTDDYPELAVFSAITAEEESATAIFQSLKQLKYTGSENLKIKSHVHKAALHPFFLAMGKGLKEWLPQYSPTLELNMKLSPDRSEKLRTRLTVNVPGRGETWVYPFPPLNFHILVNDYVHDFSSELHQLASEKNAKSAHEYVCTLANHRNQALYASPAGIPHWTGSPEKFIRYRHSVVFSHLMALLMIHPYLEHQAFVQQSLSAFLQLLNILPKQHEET